MEIENDKCIFMLIMAMSITPDRWHNNNAKIHQSEGCLFFWNLAQEQCPWYNRHWDMFLQGSD